MEIIETETYANWFNGLKDKQAKARINARIRRISLGNIGDVKPLKKGLFEIRFDFGPGYRIYYIESGQIMIILLAGGDKSTQKGDINRALEIAQDWRS